MVRHKMLPPTLSTIGRNEPSRLSCSIPDSSPILGNLRSKQTFCWILRLAFPAVSLAEPNPPLPFLPLIEVSFASPSTWLIPFKNPQVHLVDGLPLNRSTFKPCVCTFSRGAGSPWWLSHMFCSVDPWVLLSFLMWQQNGNMAFGALEIETQGRFVGMKSSTSICWYFRFWHL